MVKTASEDTALLASAQQRAQIYIKSDDMNIKNTPEGSPNSEEVKEMD